MRRVLLAIFLLQGVSAAASFVNAVAAVVFLGTAGYLLLLYSREEKKVEAELLAKMVHERTAELVELVHQHQHAASTDPLTGLLNRRGGTQEIGRHLARCRRIYSPISFLMVDIDYFKKVNDTYGHCFGDDVLIAVGKTVTGHLRASDFAVRWGGEELLIVLPDTDLAGSIRVGEKLRAMVGEIQFAQNVRVTISVGASEVEESEEFTTTIARADMNLYVAKASGRNCIRPDHQEKELD